MTFTWFAPAPLHTPAQWMATFIQAAADCDMPDQRGAAVLAAMCAFQEAGAEDDDGVRQIWIPGNNADPCFYANPNNYPHDSMANDGLSTGSFQQQMNEPGTTPWGWGGNYGDCFGTAARMDPYKSTVMFMSLPGSGLKDKGYDASGPQVANDSIQAVQGSGVPWAYAQWWDLANVLYDHVSSGSPPPVPAAPVSDPVPAPAAPGTGQTYTVTEGDTLSEIAGEFGVSLQELMAVNPVITDPDLIYPGQELTIP